MRSCAPCPRVFPSPTSDSQRCSLAATTTRGHGARTTVYVERAVPAPMPTLQGPQIHRTLIIGVLSPLASFPRSHKMPPPPLHGRYPLPAQRHFLKSTELSVITALLPVGFVPPFRQNARRLRDKASRPFTNVVTMLPILHNRPDAPMRLADMCTWHSPLGSPHSHLTMSNSPTRNISFPRRICARVLKLSPPRRGVGGAPTGARVQRHPVGTQ